tara:strand:+ start:602 stop:844 length:243 start_codon:yes stop_codon:yes gene_type:complete
MTDKQIEQLAIRTSQLVLDGILQNALIPFQDDDAEEQSLLAELAGAMTALDFNLQEENYSACEELKQQINKIENKLNKFK